MRGEHLLRAIMNTAVDGSPPHERGALWCTAERDDSTRVTPACAGSTSVVMWTRRPGDEVSMSARCLLIVRGTAQPGRSSMNPAAEKSPSNASASRILRCRMTA